MTGFAAARWYPDTPGKSPVGGSQRRFWITCGAPSSPITGRALPIPPPTAGAATTHPQPLAQPTGLRHPGSRCDIDSHPDCRPLLTLIVAPHVTARRARLGSGWRAAPLPGGCRTRWIATEGFSSCFLLSRTWPGAIKSGLCPAVVLSTTGTVARLSALARTGSTGLTQSIRSEVVNSVEP